MKNIWESTIKPDLFNKLASISELKAHKNKLYWLEFNRKLRGAKVLISCNVDNGKIEQVTSNKYNLNSQVHEYGGGSYAVSDNLIAFVNHTDQQIYLQKMENHTTNSSAKVICIPTNSIERNRYAALTFNNSGSHLFYVLEQHDSNSYTNLPTNLLGCLNVTTMQQTVLAQSHDHYFHPTISADDAHIAWICYNQPSQPWLETELWLAKLADEKAIQPTCLMKLQDVCVTQPKWKNNSELVFLANMNGWSNPYQYDIKTKNITPLITAERDYDTPDWVFGLSNYAIDNRENILLSYVDQEIAHVGYLENNSFKKIYKTCSEFRDFVSSRGKVYCIMKTPVSTATILEIDLNKKQAPEVRTIYETEQILPQEYISIGKHVIYNTKPASENSITTAHGYYYPPQNPHHSYSSDTLPPLIIFCHGGPTARVSNSLNLKVQLFTSRGFAVFDCNYRGSTGFGKDYMMALKGQYGIIDAYDCINAAKYLIQQGLANPEAVFIRGGSSSGLTVLNAVAFSKVFTAAACYYPVTNLADLANTTHKFESHYLDWLVGKYPQQKQLYADRTPLNYIHKISCPILIFQGLLDKVVPPKQAESLHKMLTASNANSQYITYEDEGHGFRNNKNLEDSFSRELTLYSAIINI